MEEAEIKHGRMAMLAWTGVWATESGLHFPGAPVADDWTNALGVWAREDPGGFGIILGLIAIAEGEGVSHAGDNFRGVSKKIPGDMGFDWMGMTSKLSADKLDRYKVSIGLLFILRLLDLLKVSLICHNSRRWRRRMDVLL